MHQANRTCKVHSPLTKMVYEGGFGTLAQGSKLDILPFFLGQSRVSSSPISLPPVQKNPDVLVLQSVGIIPLDSASSSSICGNNLCRTQYFWITSNPRP